jgi:hypothetical protein
MLKIIKLNRRPFKVPGGYVLCTGYALLENANDSYIAFKHDDGLPYIPCGGKKALQSILDAGGFVGFDNMTYVVPMN